MAEFHTVFKRYEKKYILKGDMYRKVRERLDSYMEVDEYGLSNICNIYYDTPQYDLISRSIEKPAYKEKLRLRSYGVPKEDDIVFLEMKKKYDGVVYKRRIPLKLKDAKESIRQRKIIGATGQIAKELEYVLQRYKPTEGTYLAYDRIAMYGKEDPELRVTFDFNIRSRQTDMDLSAGDEGECILPEDYVVMEVKVGDAYPFWVVNMLEEIGIYPASFSKYGNVYTRVILPQMIEKRKKRLQVNPVAQKETSHRIFAGNSHKKQVKENAYV